MLQKIVDKWNNDDKDRMNEMLQEGDNYEYTVSFEYPYLVRKNIVKKRNGELFEFLDKKDTDRVVYND